MLWPRALSRADAKGGVCAARANTQCTHETTSSSSCIVCGPRTPPHCGARGRATSRTTRARATALTAPGFRFQCRFCFWLWRLRGRFHVVFLAPRAASFRGAGPCCSREWITRLLKHLFVSSNSRGFLSTAFCAGPLASKKKVGVEQEKQVGHVRLVHTWLAPSSDPFANEKLRHWLVPGCCGHRGYCRGVLHGAI
jgi:hypothetical protein